MADDKFKLPKSSYEELVKIINGYGEFNGPVGLEDVNKQTGQDTTIISRNVGFLVDVGVLEGGRDKQCTSKGRGLAKALMHNMPEEIRRLWATIVNECEFLTRVVAAVRIRQGMDEATISSHIAYSAGQPKNSGVMTGARTVVDILRAAELLHEQDGKLTAVNVVTVDAAKDTSQSGLNVAQTPSVGSPQTASEIAAQIPLGSTQVHLSIAVKVECTPADLDSLGIKLRQLMRELSETQLETSDPVTSEGNG